MGEGMVKPGDTFFGKKVIPLSQKQILRSRSG